MAKRRHRKRAKPAPHKRRPQDPDPCPLDLSSLDFEPSVELTQEELTRVYGVPVEKLRRFERELRQRSPRE